MDRVHAQYGFHIVIEGDARGVDRIAGEWGCARGLELIEFPADWKNEGHHVALIRSVWMLNEGKPDLVVAFPGDGGARYTYAHAEKLSIPIVKSTPSRG